ncbi:MAG: carbohydrate kinase [Archangium sp.]|nr:carbohydrate kinase [Archangium sp.]
MKSFDVVSVGEALVDFLPNRRGLRVRDVSSWVPCLGGAPSNVAVGVARLGRQSALVGVTGDDEFGHFIRTGLEREGVDTSRLRHTAEGKTGLGFVSLTESGERSFTFYRQRAAEMFLSSVDTVGAQPMLDAATFAHVGTNSLLQPRARAAMRALVRRRMRRGALSSCDPNLRLHLWKQPEQLRALLDELLPSCAVVKLSHEEIQFVTGTKSVDAALKRLEANGVLLPVVTLGADGAAFRFHGRTARVAAPAVNVVDTTGAGDGFMSGLLSRLAPLAQTREALAVLPFDALPEVMRFGCRVGSEVVQHLGAVAGLPRWREAKARR